MFKLNQPTRTIKGELVVPFLVEGRLVHVVDKDKNEKIIDLSDFDFEPKKIQRPKLIVVTPSTGIIPEPMVEEIPMVVPEIIPTNISLEVIDENRLLDNISTIITLAPIIVPEPTIPDTIIIESPKSFSIEMKDSVSLESTLNTIVTPAIPIEVKKTFVYKGTKIMKISNKTSTLLKLNVSSNIANDFYGEL